MYRLHSIYHELMITVTGPHSIQPHALTFSNKRSYCECLTCLQLWLVNKKKTLPLVHKQTALAINTHFLILDATEQNESHINKGEAFMDIM